jgi:hypothetical protein
MQWVLFIGLYDHEFTRNHYFTNRLKVQAFTMKVSSLTVQEQLELANWRQRLDIEIQKFEDNISFFIAEDDSGDG